MFPWMMPGMAGMGGQLSLLSMMQGGGARNPQAYWSRMLSPTPFADQGYDDRADQQGNANQPDVGNTMGPPQGAPGGPDRNPMSPDDPNTVVRPGEQSFGWQASPWMRALNGIGRASPQHQRSATNMGMLGLSMLQPRQPTHTGPYPWI